MFDVHKPVIASVQGNCMAGGTDLALMCDVVIAAEDAKIGFPATRANGTPPNHMWVYHVGPQWAKRLLLTGDCVWGGTRRESAWCSMPCRPTELDEEVNELARRMSCVDADLLAAQKRVVNMALELSGAKTLQRFSAEMDARAHLAKGPRRTQFKQDMAGEGLKTALKNRDAPFGDGMVKIHSTNRHGGAMADILIDEPVAGVRRITLNRPEQLNAFTFDMYAEYQDALARAQARFEGARRDSDGCRQGLLLRPRSEERRQAEVDRRSGDGQHVLRQACDRGDQCAADSDAAGAAADHLRGQRRRRRQRLYAGAGRGPLYRGALGEVREFHSTTRAPVTNWG